MSLLNSCFNLTVLDCGYFSPLFYEAYEAYEYMKHIVLEI